MASDGVSHLVVDASALIRCPEVVRAAENVYVTPEVVDEVRDKQSKTRVGLLPLDWKQTCPNEETIIAVKRVAQCLGELKILSLADIGVIALAVEVQTKYGDPDKIRWDVSPKAVLVQEEKGSKVFGFSAGVNGDWVTPSNVDTCSSSGDVAETGPARLDVACATLDYSIQNVLLHLGIAVVSSDGHLITELRRYAFACTCCNRQSVNWRREFCYYCGNRSLKKCALTTHDDGTVRIDLPACSRPARKTDISWMSSIDSLRRNGGVVVTEEQLRRKKHLKGQNSSSKQGQQGVYLSSSSSGPFAFRDTTTRAFVNGFHLRKSRPTA